MSLASPSALILHFPLHLHINTTLHPSFVLSPLPPDMNPDWEQERILHHGALTNLGLLPVPDWVPASGPSETALDFPLPTYRCHWSWCPLCVPLPLEGHGNASASSADPAKPRQSKNRNKKKTKSTKSRVARAKRAVRANKDKNDGTHKEKSTAMAIVHPFAAMSKCLDACLPSARLIAIQGLEEVVSAGA
jgi:hypothetical protein